MITLVVVLFVLYGVVLWRYHRQGDLVTGGMIAALFIMLIQDTLGQKIYLALVSGWWTPAWIAMPICILFLASIIYDLERKRRLRNQLTSSKESQ